ncbi:MAG TPA: hypothetical protein VGH80_05880 [Xanthomonadaceae bacterium]|jgi:hypothetical protein
MPQRFALRFLFAAIALGVLASDVAWAQRYGRDPHDGGLPASVRRIQRETGGEVLKAQPFERDGREVYRVKVLTPQGRIRVYEEEPHQDQMPRDMQAPPSYPRGMPAPAYPRAASPAYQRMPPQQYPISPRGHRHPE